MELSPFHTGEADTASIKTSPNGGGVAYCMCLSVSDQEVWLVLQLVSKQKGVACDCQSRGLQLFGANTVLILYLIKSDCVILNLCFLKRHNIYGTERGVLRSLDTCQAELYDFN